MRDWFEMEDGSIIFYKRIIGTHVIPETTSEFTGEFFGKRLRVDIEVDKTTAYGRVLYYPEMDRFMKEFKQWLTQKSIRVSEEAV